MRFRGHSASILVVSASVFMAACSAKNEVVAEQLPQKTPDASSYLQTPPTSPAQCAPGHYEGLFNSYKVPGSGGAGDGGGAGGASGGGTSGAGGAGGGLLVPVTGTFSFDLEPLRAHELTQKLEDNAKLKGSTTAFTFDATIAGSADCNAGTFSSQLVGTLSFPGPGQGSDIPFYGTVGGYYNQPPTPPDAGPRKPTLPPTFSGEWQVFQTTTQTQLSAGTWSAYWVSPPP